jgi:hypothetical protein
MTATNYIPSEIQSSAAAAFFSHRKAILLEEIQRAERLHAIRKEYIDALVTEFGTDQYSRYAQVRAETRDKLRSLRKSPSNTLNNLTAEHKARSEILAESWQLVTSLGVDREKIKAVQRTYSERAQAELQMTSRRALSLSSEDIRGPGVVPSPTGRPVVPMSAPWFYSNRTQTFNEGTEKTLTTSILAHADHLSRNVDIESEIHIVDPSEVGYAYLRAEASIGGILRLPTAGTLFISIDLDAREVIATGNLSNLWGVSDLTGRIEISCFARFFPMPMGAVPTPGDEIGGVPVTMDEMGGPQVFDTGHLILDGAEFWSDIRFPPGDRKSFAFASSQAYPAGTIIILALGTGLYHGVWADDVTIESDIISKWNISNVKVGMQI